MKTIHLNLAARPYRDYRPVYAVVLVLALATATLMIYNVQTAYHYFVNTSDTRARIEQTEAEAKRQQDVADSIQQRLKNVDRKELNLEASYINAQIAERAFSWSRLLDDLERVIPKNVRLSSLNPSTTREGLTHLEITAGARESDGMVRFIEQLLQDPAFTNPYPRAETEVNGDYEFSIGVDYLPQQQEVAR